MTSKVDFEILLDSDAAYLSLACQRGTNNVAVGTELSHSQACVLIWYVFHYFLPFPRSLSPLPLYPNRGTLILILFPLLSPPKKQIQSHHHITKPFFLCIYSIRNIYLCNRDTRTPRTPFQRYTESHNDDVTDLHFHPTLPHCLLSGSTDGLVNIYDIRITDEDDALVQVANHGSSVSKAGFLSPSSSSGGAGAEADFFFALSHDETFAVYHLNGEGGDDATDDGPPSSFSSSATVFGDLRSKLDCEYIVDVIPSRNGSEAIIVAGSHR